jgi:predicted Zn-dependent protease
MNDPETPPNDPLAPLLAAADRDAPPPDAAFLARLRELSAAAFEDAGAPVTPSEPPTSPRKRLMIPLLFRWAAAAVAALLFLGAGVAVWLNLTRVAPPDPAPDEKFKIEPGLVDDGRIGKVSDVQGVVAVRPVAAERWSPVQTRLVLKPGDWLRTDARGANAVAVRLAKAALVVGPHSTVELVKANELRLIAGEMEVDSADAVELTGPDNAKVSVKGKQVYRVEKEKLVRVEAEPKWLKGFKGATADESLGSLVATVDGRNVPLAVGYHHVTVDIRDQIARTTIEESFVNTTPTVLEGVFHFPLPQDASISGFGMWIGNELVEADVVEKQRAREIFEDIMRSNRDPALLEWAGGNIFKARVFPIPGNSEKRIKITYTQVLPLRGNRYQYSYGLHSELLKQRPLRELKVSVTASSSIPLKAVSSPTHPVRVEKTAHAGRVEFAAQEYTPTRDLEAVFEVDAGRPDVVVVPHRRGDDGYFMVQLTPPGAGGDWDRPLVPTGEPLRLVLLADTSASMDKSQRANQVAVLAALFGSLTPKDTFNLAACDVNCDWAFDKPMPATPANTAQALDFLSKQSSLGWTDLDKAFASALEKCGPGTHLIYLGDGASTTGTADPVAFGKRLQQLYAGKGGTAHAVALGNSYEPQALKAIAALGGGSVRRVTGDRGPQATAFDLLTEIAAPVLRDLKVSFKGLRTARVYPEVLPNVPAGTQQILLGRYLPEGKDQSGEIVVSGTLAGKPVQFTSKISLKDAEKGNSFVPRLWARQHLDTLLEQGSGAKADVIALSEEFHIITPYTSFLVLESDADRERYAVKRRVQMRDGERFFQDGADAARFALKQKQIQQAADYRTALRRSVLAQLQTLGRDTRAFRGRPDVMRNYMRYDWPASSASEDSVLMFDAEDAEFDYAARDKAELRGFASYDVAGLGVRFGADFAPDGYRNASGAFAGRDGEDEVEKLRREIDSSPAPEPGAEGHDSAPALTGEFERWGELKELAHPHPTPFGLEREDGGWMDDEFGRPAELKFIPRSGKRVYATQLEWLGRLFPPLPAAGAPKDRKPAWPDAALALSNSLLRTDAIKNLTGGLVVTRQTDGLDGEALASRVDRLDLVSPGAWLSRVAPTGGPVALDWADAKERGAIDLAFQLGRVRPSNESDRGRPPLDLGDYSVTPLHVAHAGTTAAVEVIAKDRSLLILKSPGDADHELRVLIDTARHVVLSRETRRRGKVTGTTTFSVFGEVAGRWWARRVEALDADGRRTALTAFTVAEVSADEFARQFALGLAARDKVLFLRSPLPSLTDAKARAAAGTATFDDRAALVIHFASSQQWGRAAEHLAAAEKLAGDRPGVRWLRDAFLLAARRHDDLRTRLLQEAKALADAEPAARANEYALAEHVFGQGQRMLSSNELLDLIAALKPVYERQPEYLKAVRAWRERQARYTESAGRADAARALFKALAADFPRDARAQIEYTQALARSGDYPAAYAHLTAALAGKWDRAGENALRDRYADLLRDQARWRDLADFLAEWGRRDPQWDHVYSIRLAALVRSNQAKRAEELAAEWLRAGQVEGELPAAVAARLRAAVAFLLGNGYGLNAGRVEEGWLAPLADAARFFARRDTHLVFAAQILNSSQFTSSDAGRAARKELFELLVKAAGTLPLERLDSYVKWAWADDAGERDGWKKVAAALRKRWDAEKNADAKHHTGQVLARVLSWVEPAERLPFLRAELKDGPAAFRPAYARALFDALLSEAWTAAIEDEAFALLPQQADPVDEPARALFARVAALHRLTDRMLALRVAAERKAIKGPEKLTRTELQKQNEEAVKRARAGFADRLRKEAAKADPAFAGWLVAEQLWLDVQLERDPKAVAADAWAHLPAVPKGQPEDSARAALDDLLRDRLLTVLANGAARKAADPALADRLLKYVDEQVAARPNDPHWKDEKHRLLIAFDRVKELEAELRRWAAAESDSRWKVALGYLLAEQGKLPEAIKELEAVRAADELSPAAYRALAAWYEAEGNRDEYDKARVAGLAAAGEYELSRRLNVQLRPWEARSGPLPPRLDDGVLDTFAALFEKSATPQNYLDELQQFYVASRDFRLLAVLPDAVVGHSAGKVYPFLRAMVPVLGEIRDEATADELVKRIAAVRERAKTPVDRRALDLLELMAERRAAEVQNQPGPHADNALKALERAFKAAWAAGEPRLMADVLAALENVPHAAIAREQLRQLEVLHRDAPKGSFDRLRIALRYAETVYGYGRKPEATDLLAAALAEFEQASGGALPASANDVLDRLVSYAESARHYERGEKLLLAQLAHPVHPDQRDWLARRLYELYFDALRRGGAVSLGSGEGLYKALEKKFIADVQAGDQHQRYRLLDKLADLYKLAHRQKVAAAAADLKAFTAGPLPAVLKDQHTSYEYVVRDFADATAEVLGPRAAIAFLLDRAADQPDWLRYTGRDAWGMYAQRIAEWREGVKDLGDVEPRLLAFVRAELRRDLRTQSSRAQWMYSGSHARNWPEKAADFARVAEEVLAEKGGGSARTEYVAEYLYFGVRRHARAIEVLQAAHEQKRLSEAGQMRLAEFLHYSERYAESIPLLQALVGRRGDRLDYRVRLMAAYSRTGKPDALLALLKETDERFHEGDRWTEDVLATLAKSAADNRLFPQAAAYYEELIPRYRRENPRGAGSDGTLSGYYANAARAYAGLGDTKKAVEAASGAVVSWGPDRERRKRALEALVDVLVAAPDLPKYVAELDKEPLQSAIVRKAIGQAFAKRKDHARAIPSLRMAADLQPGDSETYALLVECFDALGDGEMATAVLLEAVELSRRDLALYERLGNRYADLKRPGEAERAFTSMVEMQPNESESHAALAEVREKQKRWPEAIAHWQRVAELRSLEPTGLVRLAAAEIGAGRYEAAVKTLAKVRNQSWPPRFDADLDKARELERKLEKRKK